MSHSARVWNYWLGGKDNYPVDHEAGDQFAAILPSIVDVARASLDFTQPIALMVMGTIEHIMDTDEAYAIDPIEENSAALVPTRLCGLG